jgi:hypothetical protein
MGTFAKNAGIEIVQDEFNNIEVWQLDASGELELGYGFIDDTLFIGSSRYALRMAANADANPLSRVNAYIHSTEPLMDNRGLFYFNAEEAIQLIYRNLSTYEQGSFDKDVRPYIDSIQSVAISTGPLNKDNWLHGTIFIKIKE